MASSTHSRRTVVKALSVTGATALLGTVGTLALTSRAFSGPSDPTVPPTPSASPLPDLTDLPAYEYEARDLHVTSQGEAMPGRLYVPATDAVVPLVVCSHGLGGSLESVSLLAQSLARLGLAAYCFSFRGGGPDSGDMTRMSVMTEVTDLEAVLAAARGGAGDWGVVDPGKIVLLGQSQGGEVSAVTAARHPEQVAGLALWYPAFSITDTIRVLFGSLDKVPARYDFMDYSLGRVYAEDMWDYDVYAELAGYTAPVVMIHGAIDVVVPYRYSERAQSTYPDATLMRLTGAGHGFEGEDWKEALAGTVGYLQRLGLLRG